MASQHHDLTWFSEHFFVETRLHYNSRMVVSLGTLLKNNKKVIIRNVENQKTQEAQLLRKLRHVVGVVNLIGTFEFNATRQLIVTEFFGSSNLARYLKRTGPLPENTTRHIATQLVSVVQSLYNQHILHPKIIPANILIDSKTLEIRLHNFDTAVTFEKDTPLNVPIIENISPPEYLNTSQVTADGHFVWQLGLIFYELMFNRKPFLSKYAVLEESIVIYPCFLQNPVDIAVFVLLAKMLEKTPLLRLPLSMLHYHPWFKFKKMI